MTAFYAIAAFPFLGKRFDPAQGSRYTPKKTTKPRQIKRLAARKGD